MKSLLLIAIFIFSGLTLTAQTESAISFLKEINHFSEKNILISKTLDTFTISEIKEHLRDGKINIQITYSDKRIIDTFKLSKAEQNYISDQLNIQGKEWLTKYYLNVTEVDIDSIVKKESFKIYNCTRPIFLRQNSLCLFYSDYYCGSLCGQGFFNIYKKEKGKWVLYWTIYSWIS